MSRSGIQFFNRYTGQVETEKVYGESWLRFVLFNPFGQLALHAVVKRAWFSNWYGWRMNQSRSVSLVRPFIEQYDIAEEEHVKAVLLHEFLHVLLNHTGEYEVANPAVNLALDAVINHIIHRSCGPEC